MLAAVVSVALALAAHPAGGVPSRGVLVPGTSLAGVRLGDAPERVRLLLGTHFDRCGQCREPTWYYLDERPAHEPLGIGVSFRDGRVSALFTLGAPPQWRTREGLRVGDGMERVRRLYPALRWRACVGYLALSRRTAHAVTSIYATGEVVYGFALTRPGEPVCR